MAQSKKIVSMAGPLYRRRSRFKPNAMEEVQRFYDGPCGETLSTVFLRFLREDLPRQGEGGGISRTSRRFAALPGKTAEGVKLPAPECAERLRRRELLRRIRVIKFSRLFRMMLR
jgi:hypothetical protein